MQVSLAQIAHDLTSHSKQYPEMREGFIEAFRVILAGERNRRIHAVETRFANILHDFDQYGAIGEDKVHVIEERKEQARLNRNANHTL
jgi:hypothetical protein